MLGILTWTARIIAGIGVMIGGVWAMAPRETVDLAVSFDPVVLADGVDAYLAAQEARFDDITPGTEKRVVWAGAPEERTPVSIVYLHGFSATSEEIRPVPDRVAKALGANLVFTRFHGHGRPGTQLDGQSVRNWMTDVAEALAIGRATGERVIVMATSTGATWATLALHDPDLAKDVAGLAMISPNFRIKNPAAVILTWPGVRWWGPIVAGAERRYEPISEAHGAYWTTAYPTTAVLPMAAGVAAAAAADHGKMTVPVHVYYDPRDQVVDHTITAQVMSAWGGPVTKSELALGPSDDPNYHVVAGDILSPNQTDHAVATLTEWMRGL